MKTTVIKIGEVDNGAIRQDSLKRNFKVITVQETGLIKTPWGLLPLPDSQAKSRNVSVWEKNLSGKADAGFHDPIFNKANPANGGYFQGALVTRETLPYTIVGKTINGVKQDDRIATSATALVYGDPEDKGFEVLVKSAFKRNNWIVAENTASAVASDTPVEQLEA